MARQELVAVVVSGKRNVTRISPALPLTEETLERFAQLVAMKKPGKLYYVAIVDEATWGLRQKDVILRWHVGEGMSHKEGWWVG